MAYTGLDTGQVLPSKAGRKSLLLTGERWGETTIHKKPWSQSQMVGVPLHQDGEHFLEMRYLLQNWGTDTVTSVTLTPGASASLPYAMAHTSNKQKDTEVITPSSPFCSPLSSLPHRGDSTVNLGPPCRQPPECEPWAWSFQSSSQTLGWYRPAWLPSPSLRCRKAGYM